MNTTNHHYDKERSGPEFARRFWPVLLLGACVLSAAGVVMFQLATHKTPPPSREQVITIRDDGAINLAAAPVTLAELEQRLGARKAQAPDFPIMVKGTAVIPYQSVMDVLGVLGNLGISQVGLAISKAPGK